MSWLSRAGGSWGGRFSPFGRPSNPESTQVNDGDFSYITSEDLENSARKEQRQRDTDVLVFKKGKTSYPIHFPAGSVEEGELTVGSMRVAVAKKVGTSDPRRIRLTFMGKGLKVDERTARDEGFRGDSLDSAILVDVDDGPIHGNGATDNMGMPGQAHRSWSEDEDEDDTEEVGASDSVGTKKKSRKRGARKSKKKGNSNTSGTSTPGLGYTTAGAGAEFLPIPSHVPGPRPASATPTPRAATPATPLDKLEAIASKFYNELEPMCKAFMANPPEEPAKKDFEYKKLSETILQHVLLKLDGVEAGDDVNVRAERKALVKKTQSTLNALDEYMGKK